MAHGTAVCPADQEVCMIRRTMIKEIWKQICDNNNVRQNLSSLRQEIKEKGDKELLVCMAGSEDRLVALLKDEDAKTRRNAALLMGELGKKEYLEPIYQAYEAEEQLFVKSSYLSAMKNFDYREYLSAFKSRLEALSAEDTALEKQKHVAEEMRELSSMIVMMEGVDAHPFTGEDEAYTVVLLTNRNYPEVTLEELKNLDPGAQAKVFGAGVMARVTNLNWRNRIRTYQELLFAVDGMKVCPMDAAEAAGVIVNSGLMEFLAKGHEGEPPFYFRVELKCKLDLDKRGALAKKLSFQIEKLSGRRLINDVSNYEFEIRLIENKEGSFNVLVKLYTLKDERFTYRRQVVPSSIRPYQAALAVKLAEAYRKENAQVLDPFCGVGTMLMERGMAGRTKSMYGLDIQEEAVIKARKNLKAAESTLQKSFMVNYINRDFFTFKHEYLFDEIITNMPFQIGRKTAQEIRDIYTSFFPAARAVLKPDGIIMMYSHDAEYVKRLSVPNGFEIVKAFEISMKEGTYVYILRRINI